MSRIEEIRTRIEAERDVSASKQSVSAIAQMSVDRKHLLAEYDRMAAKNARLTAERDAAVADLYWMEYCGTCAHERGCEEHIHNCGKYEWRGRQEGQDGKA